MDSVVIALFLVLFCLIMGAVCSACDKVEQARLRKLYWDVYDLAYLLWAASEGMIPLPEDKSLEECKEALRRADATVAYLGQQLERRVV